MSHRRKRKNPTAQRLKALICVLVVVLIGLLVLALLQGEPGDTLQTDPSIQTDPTHTDPIRTDPTQTAPSTEPTRPQQIGWVEQNGKKYYYEAGTAVTGPHTIDGKIYCFDDTGALLSAGWQQVQDHRYYLAEDGSAITGWLDCNDGRYYLRADGTMARGEEEIDGVRYYFTSAGRHIYVVNPWNYVPEGYEPELVDLSSRYAAMKEYPKPQVDASCYDALIRMMDACMNAGHNVCVVSSYRPHEYQESLFERQVTKQMNALNCTREEAEVIAATISAIPGTSEHQLGLAVDIIDTEIWDLTEAQENLPGQKWLMEHCWEYGFILRYPKDKTPETGIIYEPWHYRYVGLEVAAELHESGLTLEEYLAALD